MLHIYLARNGSYRAEPLLRAGYQAQGNSMEWLLDITTAASDPEYLLSTVRESDWILKSQRSQLLAHILELVRSKAQAHPGEDTWELDQAESNLISSLLDDKKFAETRAELSRIPDQKRRTSPWLGADLRIADADGSLARLIAQWRKHPESAPASNDLRNAVNLLSEPSKRIVLRFVYEQRCV